MGFADNMRVFAEDVRQCCRTRTTDLGRLHDDTQQLLTGARTFVQRLEKEHQDRADHVRSSLAANHNERQAAVKALRHDIARHLRTTQKQMREMLDQSNRDRHEKIGGLLKVCAEVRTALAADLQEAGRLWRGHDRS